ncbi:uncharacterized protein LOC106087756 isoform X6 [Stomoxys calcitrans]|uniref:uncharacterized protein LOC106087756 isoform X6 n=1 Tax=Stomoxys calcitrans TaxID=35570 RepID=UPI0027E33327|nr:uncharacterized protein LOC106087756 isoform X6 [Stomoxys calcitrans]
MPPKRRRRFQGLYYHSSPPKVLPMNGQLPNDSARRRRGSDDFSVKLSTIRIWMHEKDIGKLTRILWAGQGNRLRQQASTNPKVKRFLSTVPYVMNSIKDVHQAVIENNLENLQANLEPPVPPALVTCRDVNGLNLIHKAAGLGHATILEYLIATWPDGVNECDITGKTPLHWAASAKNNMRCYTLLTQAGCDEEAVDYKMKTPSFYRHKPNEIERAFLTYVPEAPRVSPDISTDWDALSDDNGSGKKLDIRIPEMNGFGRHSNTESNENTSEAEMTEGVSAADDEDAGGGDDEALTEEPEKEEAAEQEANEEEKAEEAQEDAPAADEEDAKADDEEVGAEDDEAEEAQEAEQDATENKEDEPQDEKQTQSVNESNAIMDEPKENEETEAQAETEVEPETDITTNEAAEETNSADNGEENHDKTNENESKDNDTNKEEGTQENEESNKEENEKGVSETNNEEVNNENTTADSEVKESTEEAASEEPKQNGEQLEDNHETKEQTNDKEENETESTEDNESNKEVDNVVESKDSEEKESHKENLLNEENSKQSENEAATMNGEGKQDDDENENINNNGEESKVISEQNKEDNTETNETGKDNEELNNEEQKNEELNNEELNNEELNNKELNNKEQSNEKLNNEDDHEAGKEEDKSKGGEEEKNNHEGDEYENEQFEDENVNEPEKEEENETKEVPDEPNDIENETKGDATESNNIVIEANGVETKTNDIENKAFDEAKPNEVPEDSSSHDKDNSTEDENNNNTNDESLQNGTEEAETQQLENSSSHIEKKDNSEPSNEEDSQETEQSLLQDIREGLTQKFDEISENLNDNIQELSNKITNIFTSSDDKGKTDETESGDVVLGSASPKSKDHPKVNGIRSGSRKSAKNVGGGTESSDDLADDEDEEPEVATVVHETSQEEEKEVEKVEDQADEVDAKEVDAKELDAKEVDANEADGNGGDPEEDAEGDADSPTSSLAIEGFVHGDAEDNTVQSQTAAYESRIDKIIASGDMEKLAQIVLNGDGQKLLDVNATEPEIQAFLRNVPNYMDKIRRVHEASRNGSLLNLQQALDRRKFAIAKDEISPNGATPLHVAVLFGHSDIVRYLAARFPETTTTTDVDGRTALHYAAVIKDNGHFYNVLLQLGANPKAPDKMGKTPEQYLADDGLKENLNYGLLLKNFGAEDLESQLLNDQGEVENHSFQENPIFKTEQGKYLADNLADPLIKALTQVAHKRPQDPLQYLTNYLQNFVATRHTNGRTIVQAAVHSGSSHTNSTALVKSNPTPPTRQIIPTSRMNGHVKRENADDIEADTAQQMDEEYADESDAMLSKRLEERDEHGQSMLHFASARSHRRGGIMQLIEESNADITYRDELYRTARDVALQANQVINAKDIDRYLISLAVVGDVKPFEYFAISGYDHIIDVMDDNDTPIIDVAESKGHSELATYLRGVRPMEELREELHQMIRDHKDDRVKEIVSSEEGKWLIMAKNYYGRTALHIAILKENEDLVEHFVQICPDALKIGDNLERSPLHYAMGTSIVEGLSRILIQNGAKRTNKDLKGRQPSYYFMNKADILRLQEEEDESR